MAASTTLITNINTVIAAGPSAATSSAVLAPAGKMMDYVGMLQNIKLSLKEIQNKLNLVIAMTDAGDGNLTTLQNMALTFS